MIQINLLDEGSRKRRSGKVNPGAAPGGGDSGGTGALVIGAVALLMLALNGGLGFWAFSQVSSSNTQVEEARKELKTVEAKLEIERPKAAALNQFREMVENQMKVLNTLDPPDRILWTQKLHMLAGMLPEMVYLHEIEVFEEVEMIETAESRVAREAWEKMERAKRGVPPKSIKRPRIHYNLRISGVALGEDNVQQFDNVMKFQEALVNYQMKDEQGRTQRFMDGFQPQVSFEKVVSTLYNDVPCNEFTFKLTSKTWGSETEAATPEKGRAQAMSTKIAAAAKAGE